MAIPQCAIAHSGSRCSTSENASCAAWYQNECCSFIAWSKACCASGVQVTGKWTVPST